MKLTVATVCFNAEKTIEATIKSVLDQTYQNIEYLIIDGRSTDRTLELIGKYQTDSRVRVISERDSGLYNAMNKAASVCSGAALLTQLAARYILIQSAFFFPLSLVNIVRFSIQGMGFSPFAILAGVLEMAARTGVGMLLVPAFGYTAACFASPAA